MIADDMMTYVKNDIMVLELVFFFLLFALYGLFLEIFYGFLFLFKLFFFSFYNGWIT